MLYAISSNNFSLFSVLTSLVQVGRAGRMVQVAVTVFSVLWWGWRTTASQASREIWRQNVSSDPFAGYQVSNYASGKIGQRKDLNSNSLAILLRFMT